MERVESQVRLALKRKVCLIAFIDLKSVYDKINHNILVNKLQNLGVRGNMLKFCETYLRNRTFRVIYNSEKSTSKRMETGVYQGRGY